MLRVKDLPDLGACGRVLVVKPSSLGDIVHTLPAVHLLKRRWPGMELVWVVNPEFAPLLVGNADVAEVVMFPRGEFRGWRGMGRFAGWLRGLRERVGAVDLALDFQGLLRSGLMSRASGAGEVVGMSDSREGARWFHGHVVLVEAGAHAVERNLAIVRALGADGSVEFALPEGSEPAGLGEAAAGGYVLLHPFSRGEGKSLTREQVRLFCEAMGARTVVVVGRLTGDRLALPSGAVDLVNGTTLPELAWLMRRAAYTVSVDSGPMHMAAALSPRVLGIHTWSDPRKVGPWDREAYVWKSGRFMKCGALDAALCSGGRPVADEDIGAIAAFVRERLVGG
jgi:ADP-heptose:LPS heptosyltransferase